MDHLTDLQAFDSQFDKKWIEQQYEDLEELKQLMREERNALEAKQHSFDEHGEHFKHDKKVFDAVCRSLEKQR